MPSRTTVTRKTQTPLSPTQPTHVPDVEATSHIHRSSMAPTNPAIQPADLLHLQRTIGNRAIARQLRQAAPLHQPAKTTQPAHAAIQRMSFDNTDWASATNVKASDSGAGGVMIFNDGGEPVVVKPGQPSANELVLAANVTNQSLGGDDSNGWKVETPRARVPDAREVANIAAAATRLFGPNPNQRQQRMLDNLQGGDPSVVFSYAGGDEFKDVVSLQTHTKKKLISQKVDKESPLYEMWKDPGPMMALGKASAIDAFMGNGDRLLSMINLENWKTDVQTKTINLIDNVQLIDANFFHSVPQYRVVSSGSFRLWHGSKYVQHFLNDDFASMAVKAVSDFAVKAVDLVVDFDKATVKAALAKHKDAMVTWFAQGLQAGKALVQRALRNPATLLQGIPPADHEEMLTSIYARKFALEGAGIDVSWNDAVAAAQEWANTATRRRGRGIARPRQQQPAQQQQPQQWNAVRPTGPRRNNSDANDQVILGYHESEEENDVVTT